MIFTLSVTCDHLSGRPTDDSAQPPARSVIADDKNDKILQRSGAPGGEGAAIGEVAGGAATSDCEE